MTIKNEDTFTHLLTYIDLPVALISNTQDGSKEIGSDFNYTFTIGDLSKIQNEKILKLELPVGVAIESSKISVNSKEVS